MSDSTTTSLVVGMDGLVIQIVPRKTAWTSPSVPWKCVVSNEMSSLILQWRPFPQGWLKTMSYHLQEGTPIRSGRTFIDTLIDAYEGNIRTADGTLWQPDVAGALVDTVPRLMGVDRESAGYIFMRDDVVPAVIRALKAWKQTRP